MKKSTIHDIMASYFIKDHKELDYTRHHGKDHKEIDYTRHHDKLLASEM